MKSYILEMTQSPEARKVEADGFEVRGGWIVFYSLPEGFRGGVKELFRINAKFVVSVGAPL